MSNSKIVYKKYEVDKCLVEQISDLEERLRKQVKLTDYWHMEYDRAVKMGVSYFKSIHELKCQLRQEKEESNKLGKSLNQALNDLAMMATNPLVVMNDCSSYIHVNEYNQVASELKASKMKVDNQRKKIAKLYKTLNKVADQLRESLSGIGQINKTESKIEKEGYKYGLGYTIGS